MLRANGNVGQLMGEGLGLDVDWMLCKDKYLSLTHSSLV